MKKEYVTVRLFKNNREADGLKEELHDSDQQHSTEALNNLLENNETVESYANTNKSFQPLGLLSFIQRALTVLGLHRKG